MSMDEEKGVSTMDTDKRDLQERIPAGPLHDRPLARSSRTEVVDVDSITRFDPETAHAAAGDTNYESSLPNSCGLCKARELAQQALEA